MYNFHDVAVAVPQTSSDVEDIEQESIIPFLTASGSIDSDASVEDSGLDPADCTPELMVLFQKGYYKDQQPYGY